MENKIWLLCCCFVAVFCFASSAPAAEPWYGDFIGRLNDPQNVGVRGDVYAVNKSCIQIIGFAYKGRAPDLYFWADRQRALTAGGVLIPTAEFGDNPLRVYESDRVVLNLPSNYQITHFRSFGLYCDQFSKVFSQISVPHLTPPKRSVLRGTLNGLAYNVGSGPVLVLDRRTLVVYGFTFEGHKAPDGYFFVGTGRDPQVDKGVKVPIRGRDTPNDIRAMQEPFTGRKTLILDLPEGYDIYSIDWLSIYCYQYGVDFGHMKIRGVSDRVPPFVPA